MKLLFSILLLSLASCSIEGSFQGLVSYYNKVKKTDLLLMKYSDSTHDLASNGTGGIVVMNGIQLKKHLTKYEKTLVYLWRPNCGGRYCYDLTLVQEFCDKNELELLVVAEYYDYAKMSSESALNNNIIGIDTDYYKSNLTSKYVSLFFADLLGKEVSLGYFSFFHEDRFISCFNSLDEFQVRKD
jgi:hypothetical protein